MVLQASCCSDKWVRVWLTTFPYAWSLMPVTFEYSTNPSGTTRGEGDFFFFRDRVCTRFTLREREFKPYITEREAVDLGEQPQATSS